MFKRLNPDHIKKERYKKLAEAEQFLLDEALILPVSHPVSLNAVDRNVLGGWFVNALNIHPFKYLYFLEPAKIEGIIQKRALFGLLRVPRTFHKGFVHIVRYAAVLNNARIKLAA